MRVICGHKWRTSGTGPGMIDAHLCNRRPHRFGLCECDCGRTIQREPRWRRWLWPDD